MYITSNALIIDLILIQNIINQLSKNDYFFLMVKDMSHENQF
jgi:hypothetical protein